MIPHMNSIFFFSVFLFWHLDPHLPGRDCPSQASQFLDFHMQTNQSRAQTQNPLPCPVLTLRRHHPPALANHPRARDQTARDSSAPRSLPELSKSANSKPADPAWLCLSHGNHHKGS